MSRLIQLLEQRLDKLYSQHKINRARRDKLDAELDDEVDIETDGKISQSRPC